MIVREMNIKNKGNGSSQKFLEADVIFKPIREIDDHIFSDVSYMVKKIFPCSRERHVRINQTQFICIRNYNLINNGDTIFFKVFYCLRFKKKHKSVSKKKFKDMCDGPIFTFVSEDIEAISCQIENNLKGFS